MSLIPAEFLKKLGQVSNNFRKLEESEHHCAGAGVPKLVCRNIPREQKREAPELYKAVLDTEQAFWPCDSSTA